MARFKIYSKDGKERYEGKPRYSGSYLKPSYLEFSEIASPEPISWEVGDYVDYPRTGMRYYLYSIPQPSKNARKGSHGRAFTYSNVQFHAATKELEIALFRDLVVNDNNIHFSTSPDVATTENVQGIADRIQVCMDDLYPDRWEIRVASLDATSEVDLTEPKDFALSGGTCLDALSKIYELWQDIGWIHTHENGKEVITIGYANRRIAENTSEPYLYGKGNGLTAIKKNQTNKDEFATRLYVYGSERNLPARYYNGKDILNAESVDIRNLMLPLDKWGTTDGLPDARKAYLENAEAVARYGVIPKTHYFDSTEAGANIYPSITGMTVGQIRKVLSDMGQTEYSPDAVIYPDDAERVDEVLSAVNPTDDGVERKDGKRYEDSKTVDISSLGQTITIPGGAVPDIRIGKIFNVQFDKTGMGVVSIDSGMNFVLVGEGISSVKATYELSDASSASRKTVLQTKEVEGTQVEANASNWTIPIPAMRIAFEKMEYSSFPVYLSIDIYITPTSIQTERTANLVAPSYPVTFNFSRSLQSTFVINLKQIGFDINERASQGAGKKISMKSGKCEGREFVISNCRYDEDTDSWSLTCKRQRDDTLGLLFPYNQYEIASGDRFVLLDIALPDSYIGVAMERLFAEGEKLLARASRIQNNYEPSIDAKVMIESGRTLREGMYMEITDEDVVDNTTDYILIDSLSIYEDESAIPTYKATLRERRKVTYKGTPSATSETKTSSVDSGEVDASDVDLSGYATKTYVDDTLKPFADMFYWEEEGVTIGTKYNFFSEGQNAAGGIGEEEGESGGGTATIVVDTAMSDTSDNAVANRVIKAYVDSADEEIEQRLLALEESGTGGGGTVEITKDAIIDALEYTPANENDIPTRVGQLANDMGYLVNAPGDPYATIQNVRNLLSYYVRAEEMDTAMSDTSTNAVQNKAIKAYVDNTINDIKANPKTYIQLKTINGMEIYGEGNIAIEGGSGEGTSGLTAINVNSQSFQPDSDGIVTLPNYRPLNYYNQDLAEKVDKVDGKGLSTNDYTTADKNKLAGIAAGAEVNVQSDWNATSGDAFIKNKPTIPVEVTETTVAGWGFTKNTGTYIKPTTGIPKSHLANDVQTSLGLADTALQPSALNNYPTTTEVSNALTNALKNYALAQDLTAVDERLADVEAFFDSKDDTDSLVNKWHEIVNFLDATEGDTLDSILSTYATGADLESAVERIAANEATINTHTSQISNHATRLSVVETKAADNATAITNIQKLFTDGKANKAIADGNGNNIVSTYATKTALAATDANVTTNATAISTLKGYFTNGKANNADKLDGYDSSYFATAANLNSLVTRVTTAEGEIDGLQEDNETFMAWYNAVGKYFKYDSVNEAWYLDGDFYATGQNAAGGIGEEEGSTGGGLDEDQLADYLTTNGYLNSIPSEYVTETELSAKGYATTSALSAYALKASLGTLASKNSLAFSELASHPTTLNGYGITDGVRVETGFAPTTTGAPTIIGYSGTGEGWFVSGPAMRWGATNYYTRLNINIFEPSDPTLCISNVCGGEEYDWATVLTSINVGRYAMIVDSGIRSGADLNELLIPGAYNTWNNTTNAPSNNATILVIGSKTNYFTSQIFTNDQGHLFSRMYEGGTWRDWRTILDDNNYTSYVYSKTDSDAKYVPFAGDKTINGNVTFPGSVQTRYINFFQDGVRTGGMAADGTNVETLYFITRNSDYRSIIHSGNISNYTAGEANRLATSRKLWGQNFNGTADVSGNLENVGKIVHSNANAYNMDEYGNFYSSATSDSYYWNFKRSDGNPALAVFAVSGLVQTYYDTTLARYGGTVLIGGNAYNLVAATLYGTFAVTGATSLNSTLSVSGATTLNSSMNVFGQATLSGGAFLPPSKTIRFQDAATETFTISFDSEVGGLNLSGATRTLGLASFSKGIQIEYGQSIAFVGKDGVAQYITLDEENGAIKVIGNFFATGQNAAGGAGGEELGMLTSWENPPTNLEGMTLSASLGIDLYNNSKKVITSWDDIPEEGDEGYEDFVLSEYTVSADLVQTMNDEITTLKNKTTPSAAIIKLTNLCSAYTSGTSGIAYTGSMANFITWTVFNSLRDGIAIKVSDTSSSKKRVWDYSVDYTASGYKFRFTLEDKYVEITSSSTTSFTSSTYTITHNL